MRLVSPLVILRRSLTARLLAIAWVATVVFGLVFGAITRTVVTRELRDNLHLRASALGEGLRPLVESAVATGDTVGLHIALAEAVQTNPSVRYVVVVDDAGKLRAHSFARRPSTGFIRIIDAGRQQAVPATLQTELGLLHDVALEGRSSGAPRIHVGVDENWVSETVSMLTIAFAIAGAVALFVGLVIASAVTYWVSQPLLRVARAADEVAHAMTDQARSGDGIVVPPGSGPWRIESASPIAEIVQLKESFNRLALSLHDSQVGLEQAQKGLIRSERMAALGAFVAGTAHAINNPLGGLRACNEMIVKNPDDVAGHQRYAGISRKAIDRIDRLVGRLVSFVRLDQGERGVFDVNHQIEPSLVVDSLAAKGQDVRVELDLSDEPLPVRGIAEEFEQALTNLVLNAMQASPAGSVVTVRSRLAPAADAATGQPDGAVVQVEVLDHGPGIPEALHDRIFEPFFSTKPEGEGTGLGLWIVWGVLERMGGGISVATTEWGGTSFLIELPVVEAGAALPQESTHG